MLVKIIKNTEFTNDKNIIQFFNELLASFFILGHPHKLLSIQIAFYSKAKMCTNQYFKV